MVYLKIFLNIQQITKKNWAIKISLIFHHPNTLSFFCLFSLRFLQEITFSHSVSPLGWFYQHILFKKFNAFLANGDWRMEQNIWRMAHTFGEFKVLNTATLVAQFGAEFWWNWTVNLSPYTMPQNLFSCRKSLVKSTLSRPYSIIPLPSFIKGCDKIWAFPRIIHIYQKNLEKLSLKKVFSFIFVILGKKNSIFCCFTSNRRCFYVRKKTRSIPNFNKGSSINDITQYLIFFIPPPPIVTLYSTKASVLSSQNLWYPLPPKEMTSFMDVP